MDIFLKENVNNVFTICHIVKKLKHGNQSNLRMICKRSFGLRLGFHFLSSGSLIDVVCFFLILQFKVLYFRMDDFIRIWVIVSFFGLE